LDAQLEKPRPPPSSRERDRHLIACDQPQIRACPTHGALAFRFWAKQSVVYRAVVNILWREVSANREVQYEAA
jgi:hypothetical protein